MKQRNTKLSYDPRVMVTPRYLFVGWCAFQAFSFAPVSANAMPNLSIVMQQSKIYGVVKDAAGVPIIGASVMQEHTTTGTVTDFDGKFELALEGKATLVISYMGYKSQQVTAIPGKELVIVLEDDTQNLDEVVVVGFGSQKKVNLTGSVAVVDSEALESRPASTMSDLLQGTVPGLYISNSSGLGMDQPASINIRGTGTIGSGSTGAPLILIDGMEGDINMINPQDVESISVLKDATSASIYGSRAPFGVILITTKEGKKGRTRINYNNSLRWQNPISLPNMMDSYTFAHFFNDAEINMGRAPWFSEDRIKDILAFQNGELTVGQYVAPGDANFWGDGWAYGIGSTDHYDDAYVDVAFGQEHNFSLNGGNEKVNYYLSANYMDRTGFIEVNPDNYSRFTVTAKIQAQVYKWLKLNYTNRFVQTDYDFPTLMTKSGFFKDVAAWPTEPNYDPNGNPYSSLPRATGTPIFGLSQGGNSESKNMGVTQQLQAIFEPIKNWKTFVDVNYRIWQTSQTQQLKRSYNVGVDNSTLYAVGLDSYVREARSTSNYTNLNAYSQYDWTMNEDHYAKVMFGFQTEMYNTGNVSLRRDGLIVDNLTSINTTDGFSSLGSVLPPTVSGAYSDWATAGFFGRLNYNYKERYLAEVNLRYDGTSRFRGDQRWGLFPSGSLGWNIARESFFEPYLEHLSTFKVRASYGELGNQNTNSFYPTYQTVPLNMSSGNYLINGNRPNTTFQPNLIDPSLTWEKIKNWNFGLDVSALSGRLSFTADYFVRVTEDMVGPAPELPDLFGAAVPKQNNTDMQTKGFELGITWRDRLENGFAYGVSASLADAVSEILEYPNPTNLLSTYRTGQKLGEIWGYQTIGIAKSDEEMQAHLESLPNGGQSAIGSKWTAGDIMYKDLNGDGKISKGANTSGDPGDLTVIGNSTPRLAYSISLDASYKGFDIRAFFEGIGKRDVFVDEAYFWGAYKSMWASLGFEEHADYFRADADHALGQNLDAYYPRPLFGGGSLKNQQVQSRYLQDASYLRLKNLQVGYTLPTAWAKRINIQNCRIFLSGENLVTWTQLSDIFDPETVTGGYYGSSYPLARTYAAGINVTF